MTAASNSGEPEARTSNSASDPRISTGNGGLDQVLGGGLSPHRLYLIEGMPGSGKTTIALQFLFEGRQQGERLLYVTLSETAEELHAVAASHGWTLDGIDILELVNEEMHDPEGQQSILYPSDVELGETAQRIFDRVRELQPQRVVIDSLSELRLLAQSSLRYRRQIMAMKHVLSQLRCTTLLLDDCTAEPGDQQLHSLAHGVVVLDQTAGDYGAERRRLRVMKMRGIRFRGGHHDVRLVRGGMVVFPRLTAADHAVEFEPKTLHTGSPELDLLLGGGLRTGSNVLFMGPSGIGKTTTAIRCLVTALKRGERGSLFLFDEGVDTLLLRASVLDMDLRPYLQSGHLSLHHVDPAELSPGEFSTRVRHAVENDRAGFVVIDSLNGYLQAMPGEHYLLLQMHEMLSYLNRVGVLTILVLGQHGLIGDVRTDVDLSYLSDTILLFRFFEAQGELLSAISVVKSRTSAHERTIRQFQLGRNGLSVGPVMRDFESVLAGVPRYRGSTDLMEESR